MGVVYESVEDCVGECGVADGLVPVVDGELGGEEGGTPKVPCISLLDFSRIAMTMVICLLCFGFNFFVFIVVMRVQGTNYAYRGTGVLRPEERYLFNKAFNSATLSGWSAATFFNSPGSLSRLYS